MVANKISNLRKCGEILFDIKSKDKKNKIYMFQCTFCNLECDQLKKFSNHIGEKHLSDFQDILEETELKVETVSEEYQIQEFNSSKKPDCIVPDNTNENPDPLDTVGTEGHVTNPDFLNCEVKLETIENDESINCDKYEINCVASLDDSDKEENLKFEKPKSNLDTKLVFNSDSESESEFDINQEIPPKKRKINFAKKCKQPTEKNISNELSSDESKDADADCNVKKESHTIKKHKRCKKRWKNIDDSKLPTLIEMYKKYEVLWQVNDIAFGILLKRTETFGQMIEELKTQHNFNKNLDELQDHIDYINYIFCKDKEQELKCELNKTEFKPSSKYYKELAFLSDSQGPFKCSNCNEIITKYDRYHIHVANHNGTIPFQCRLCEMGFQKFDNYLRHVQRHLGINSYHCNVCGKGYPFKSELDWHLTSHTGVKPYLCPICGAGFRARHGYDNHIRRHEKRFRYECHICKHGFNHLCKLNTHIKSHLNIRDVICNVCGKGFTAAKYLQRHKLIHDEEKRYKCNVCGKAFAQDSGLRTHRKQHQPYAAIAQKNILFNACN